MPPTLLRLRIDKRRWIGGIASMVTVVATWTGSATTQSESGVVESSSARSEVDAFETTAPVDQGVGFVHPAVESYASEYSVSVEVASRHLDRIDTLQDILASIREFEGSRLAGWGIDHGVDFTAWVSLTGDEPPGDATARIASAHRDVEIRLGAVHTYAELRTAVNGLDIDSIHRTIEDPDVRSLYDMVVFTGIDMRANSVEIGIDPSRVEKTGRRSGRSTSVPESGEAPGPEAEQLIMMLKDRIRVPMAITDANGFDLLADLAGLAGGQSMSTCTSGFAAKLLGGDYGIITAGHCSTRQKMFNKKLPYVKGWNSPTADGQFHRIPRHVVHALLDDYQCSHSSTRYCDVTEIVDRTKMIDNYVCHTGRSSGISCGKITDINVRPRGVCRNSELDLTDCEDRFVRIDGSSLRGCKGDSGGPVYGKDGKAYGIVKSGIGVYECDNPTPLFFSTIRDVENLLQVRVLTEDPSPPGPPEGMSAVVGSDGVSLSWQPPAEGAAGYVLYRRNASADHNYSVIAETTGRTHLDSLSDLIPGTEYHYKLKAIDNLNQRSKRSEHISITVPEPPDTPTSLEISIESGIVSLSWNAPGDAVESFEVYRRMAVPGDPYIRISSPTSNNYRDPIADLVSGAEYYYRVKAVDSLGRMSNRSDYASVILPADSLPDVPTDLNTVVGVDGVTISWNGSSGVVRYEIYRRMAIRNTQYSLWSFVQATEYLDGVSRLTPGAEYYYRVKAFDNKNRSSGWGSGLNYASATTDAIKLSVAVDSDVVSLSWADAEGDVAEYRIYRRMVNLEPDYTYITSTRSNTYRDDVSRLLAGAEYYYRIKAVSTDGSMAGWGSGSDYAAVTTLMSKPLAVIDSGVVSLSWTAPKGDVAEYEIYRRRAVKGESYKKVGNTVSTRYHDPVSELLPGAEYYYRLKVVDSEDRKGGWGSKSNYASVIIPAS